MTTPVSTGREETTTGAFLAGRNSQSDSNITEDDPHEWSEFLVYFVSPQRGCFRQCGRSTNYVFQKEKVWGAYPMCFKCMTPAMRRVARGLTAR